MTSVVDPVGSPERETVKSSKLSGRIASRAMASWGLFIALILLWMIFQVATEGTFLGSRNLINLLRQTSVTAIVGLGLLLVIAQGEFDLSVGSMLGVLAMVTALVERSGSLPFWLTILLVVALGAVIGLWNGVWVAFLGVPSFIVTLGGLLMFRGIVLLLSDSQTISGIGSEIALLGGGSLEGTWLISFLIAALIVGASTGIGLYVASKHDRRQGTFRRLGLALGLLGLAWAALAAQKLPLSVLLALILAALVAWVMANTVWGRHAYAVGANRMASRVAGINIRQHIVLGFVLVGVLTALASLVYAGRLQAISPGAGQFLELQAITAVIIGGASLYGGSGKVVGVLLGALFMQSLLNGLSLLNVPTAWEGITSGTALLLAVFLDTVSKRGGSLVLPR